jgi:hypothetical protein
MVANPRAANISSPLLVLVGASSGAAFAVFRMAHPVIRVDVLRRRGFQPR